MRVEYRDIAEAYDPLGSLPELSEIEPVNDPADPITSPGTQYGFDIGIIKHLLKVLQALLICS
jgi:hypothetical protein